MPGDYEDQDPAISLFRCAALVLLPVAPRGHPGEQASGPPRACPGLEQAGAAVTVWAVPLLPQSCRLERSKSQVHVQGVPLRAARGPRSRVPHLTGPVVSLAQRRFLTPAGLACFWTWRGEAALRHPSWAFTGPRVKPLQPDPGLSESTAWLRPLGSLAPCRLEGTLPGTRSPRRRAGGGCAWRGGDAHGVPGDRGGPGLIAGLG